VHHHYVRPTLNDGNEINIRQGRHPVVEQTLTDAHFVPNDVYLSNDDAQLIVLTGPNMSGKSTYLRQVALIVLLAQIGSFVPAEQVTIGIVDRIFTRIGAGEDIAAGQSTFMVEMIETANILHNATPRSLIILDEIGRGTSTYDGLSIARAVAEYIHNSPRLGAKTLFATHYHEMVEMAGYLPRIKNFNVAVREEGQEVIFLYKIAPGGVDRSYGIHVAQLAGLPRSVVHRAREVLEDLEGDSRTARPLSKKRRKEVAQQISFLTPKSPLLEELEKLDLDAITPLEALNKLYEMKKRAGE
jgi:DNA mismatch repair protein MutS